MRKQVHLVSDTHFGHQNICKFHQADGVTPLRPWDNVEEMNEAFVEAWNKVVQPKDKVYHLGDAVMGGTKNLPILDRLHGDKVLIRGNHDQFKLKDYAPYFRDIRGCHELKGIGAILTHIPVHPMQLYRYDFNIHGHLHDRQVCLPDGSRDLRYYCVSVEHTNWAPTPLDLVTEHLRAVKAGFKH